jgi:hypothetical protein
MLDPLGQGPHGQSLGPSRGLRASIHRPGLRARSAPRPASDHPVPVRSRSSERVRQARPGSMVALPTVPIAHRPPPIDRPCLAVRPRCARAPGSPRHLLHRPADCPKIVSDAFPGARAPLRPRRARGAASADGPSRRAARRRAGPPRR